MHLVDAIRIASKKMERMKDTSEHAQQDSVTQPENVSQKVTFEANETQQQEKASAPVMEGGGTVVRLELFLSPEQLHQMLRGIFQGAHTVMTLREAAQHLRTSITSLVKMAESGEIPAFMVDGQWRFPRQGVCEWVTLQTLSSQPKNIAEDDSNAA